MYDIESNLKDLLSEISSVLTQHNIRIYLVGGFVRDMVLRRETNDVDVSVEGNALEIAQVLASGINGKYVVLDEVNNIARVVLTGNERPLNIDVTSFSGDIETDLFGRDFTIDAMAIKLRDFLSGRMGFIDPFRGKDDLEKRKIRALRPGVFEEDGLRLLRAVRLAAELDFSIDPETEMLIKDNKSLIRTISGERIREELVKLFSVTGSSRYFSYLDELGLLLEIIPEMVYMKGVEQPKEHHWNVFDHSLKTVEAVDFLMRESEWIIKDRDLLREVPWTDEIRTHFDKQLAGGSTRKLLLKFGALLHDIAKPQTKAVDENGRTRFIGHPKQGAEIASVIFSRLRFSSREKKLVGHLVYYHLRPVQMSNTGMPTSRAVYRFFRDVGTDGIDILFLALADFLATAGPALDMDDWHEQTQLITYILNEHKNQATKRLPVKLIDGEDVMECFGLTPGPLIGKLLDLVHEAQAAGDIGSRDEAIALVRAELEKENGGIGCFMPLNVLYSTDMAFYTGSLLKDC
jgi:poly(A) polymerase